MRRALAVVLAAIALRVAPAGAVDPVAESAQVPGPPQPIDAAAIPTPALPPAAAGVVEPGTGRVAGAAAQPAVPDYGAGTNPAAGGPADAGGAPVEGAASAQGPGASPAAGQEPVIAPPRLPPSIAARLGLRDPFRPFSMVHQPIRVAGAGTPLEQYQVGQLRLVGVILTERPRAMVEDDQGNGFVVEPGMRIGPNGGSVVSIAGQELVVVEWETDVVGERHRKEYVLRMEKGPTPTPRPRR